LQARARRPASLEITALFVCLVGFIGLVATMWTLKSGGRVSREVFLLCLALTCAPMLIALWQKPKPLFLIPPVVAIFLIYPVAMPFGLVWGPDPIFNYNFTESVVASGFWVPGKTGTFEPAYSYYPVGNVFMGYVILTANLPPAAAFAWLEPILRLLAVPAAAYSIARRRFSAQTSSLGLFFYVGTASILFNVPVQQGMGTVFVALSLLALLIMSQNPDKRVQRRVLVLFLITSGSIVMTHHLSSYLFAGWIAGLALFMAGKPRRSSVAALRLNLLTVYFLVLLGTYVATFTYPIFVIHEATLSTVLERLTSPELLSRTGTGGLESGPTLGRTFSLLEVAWIGASVLGLFMLSLFSIFKYRRVGVVPFAVANGMVAAGLVFVTLPLLATTSKDVPLRVGEYANLFIAPFAAATLIRWSQSRIVQLERFIPRALHPRRWTAAGALLVAVLIFMGGSMVPSTNRVYFEAPRDWSSDSVLLAGPDFQRSAAWARDHFGSPLPDASAICWRYPLAKPCRFWGDQMAVDSFAGFAYMRVDYGSSRLFANTSFNDSLWAIIAVGDYVVVNKWMLLYTPHFLREPEPPPPAPVASGYLDKFARDPHFDLIYEDGAWAVYRVIRGRDVPFS
jgi:hypothetical protein